MSNIQCDDIKCKDITADDIKINSKSIFDLIYPIGSIYISVTSLNPNTAFPGTTWIKLQGGYALITTDNNSPNMSMEDASNHIPGEAAQGGIPNITGTTPVLNSLWNYVDATGFNEEFSGAIYSYIATSNGPGPTGSNKCQTRFGFDASRCANNYGMYQSGISNNNGRVIPDHIAVVVWRRES